MVLLNNSRLKNGLPTKLQMKMIGPCKVLEKYGANAYKVDLPQDMSISPIFNVQDLTPYIGLAINEVQYQKWIKKDVEEL